MIRRDLFAPVFFLIFIVVVFGGVMLARYIDTPNSELSGLNQSPEEFRASLKRREEYRDEMMRQRGIEVVPVVSTAESAPPSTDSQFTVGEEVTISAGGGPCTLVTKWKDDEELTKYMRANDSVGYLQMLSEGRAFRCDAGTDAKILQTGIFAYEVRILSGSHALKSGWVPTEFVRKK